MTFYGTKIKHPEWLPHCNIERTFRLVREGKCPEVIAGWMLVVALKHPLRCVYGSDLRAAWALLAQAIWDQLCRPYNYAYFLWHRKEYEREELNELIEDVGEEMGEPREGRE